MSADQRNTLLAGMPAGQEAREQELADRVPHDTWSRVPFDIVLPPART